MGKTTKNLKHTFINTILLVLLQVINIVLSTQLLGSDGRGQISLYLLHIAIGTQIGSMVGGEALVYFVPRYSISSILKISMWWNFIIASASLVTLYFIEKDWTIAVLLALAIAFHSVFQSLLQIFNGRELITKTNTAFLISQLSYTLIILLLYAVDLLSVNTFIGAMLLGIIMAILYFLMQWKLIAERNIKLPKIDFKTCIKSGATIQFGNLAQTLNARISYFLLDAFFANGKALVGVFSTALLVGEKSLVVPKSLGRVQYSEVANSTSNNASKTVLYLKMYLSLAFFTLFILAFIPNSIYTYVFGEGFSETGNLIIVLIPGLFFLMASNAMSNHFAGEGKYSINAICTVIALVISSTFAFIYVPKLGMLAAALSTDLAFVILCISQIIVFYKQNNSELPKRAFLPNKDDWQRLKNLLQKVK